MKKIPESLPTDSASQFFIEQGLSLIHQGKVRNTFRYGPQLIVVATDRISVFDFVLPTLVPNKGAILTGLTHFWLTKGPLKDIEHHLLPSKDDKTKNALRDFEDNLLEIPGYVSERSLAIKNLGGFLEPFELIFRHHIGGSVYKKYLETGKAGGQRLPSNLPKWSRLTAPIFTPSTKEDIGHDINVDAQYYFNEMKEKHEIYAKSFIQMLRVAYQKAYDYASKKGILILDTKFEGSAQQGVLADEVLTPDSSRFCDKRSWEEAIRGNKEPAFMDKQVMREWAQNIETPFGVVGLKNLDPSNEDHLAFVHNLDIPNDIVMKVHNTYHQIFEKLTGKSLGKYQVEEMGIYN